MSVQFGTIILRTGNLRQNTLAAKRENLHLAMAMMGFTPRKDLVSAQPAQRGDIETHRSAAHDRWRFSALGCSD